MSPTSVITLRKIKQRLKGTILLGVLLVTALGGWFWCQLRPAAAPGVRPVEFHIPSGVSTKTIAGQLASNGLIRSPLAFRLYLREKSLDKSLQAGTYLLSPSQSTVQIAGDLTAGRTAAIRVTIPEGYTVKQIAARLEEAGLVQQKDFLRAAADTSFTYEFLQGGPEDYRRLEGFLFPDTYSFDLEMDEQEIITAMLERFQQAFSPAMSARAAQMGLSTREVIILASIVEKEARRSDERPLIAAVFFNRLRQGGKLESCATVQYLLSKPKPILDKQDLTIESKYNTYLYPGLPVGPIASPGLASVRAVLYPASVPYMYFTANPDGSHTFNTTYAEHLLDSRASSR